MTGEARELVDRPGGFAITDRAMTLCAFPAGARLLDVGCGTGATVRHLTRNHGLEVQGVDKEPVLGEGLATAHGEDLPFREGEMDGVLLECSLSVMDDPDLVLQECRRVLKPGGRLVISDVYAHGEEAHWQGCLGRIERRETMLARVARHGFEFQCFEDFSEHLHTLWGQRVFEKGTAAFCAELGTDKARLKAVACGYCLVIARRPEP